VLQSGVRKGRDRLAVERDGLLLISCARGFTGLCGLLSRNTAIESIFQLFLIES